MERFFRGVLHHRNLVLTIFIVATIACALCIPKVNVDYNFSDYLPEDSPSTIALHKMNETFDLGTPNARLYVEGIDLVQAQEIADELPNIPYVDGVTWLADIVDLREPLEMMDPDTLSNWKSDDGYLYMLSIDTSDASGAVEAMDGIRSMAGQYSSDVYLSGDAINTASAEGSSSHEIQLILIMSFAVVFGLLLLTSESWFEPVLFLAVIGIAIVLNLGTNIFKGQISFVTQMCAAILQLAVSMDYGIVMLHAFRGFRATGLESEDAMVKAMHKSFSTITSSAATTFFGFLSLAVMVFLIGKDMGIVLAKGVAFSFICVMFVLPTLILRFDRVLNATRHRALLPPFRKFANACIKVGIPTCIIIAIIAVPAFLGQLNLKYTYGASGFIEPGTTLYSDTIRINDTFGANESWVVLVPTGHWSTELAMIDELQQNPMISSVTSYSTMVDVGIPTEMVGEDSLSQFISNGYSRIIVNTRVVKEGDVAFGLIDEVRDTCSKYYGDGYYLVGASATTYDMNSTVKSDSLRVILASILTIGIVVMIMFRSLSIPVILLLCIEISIWINLAIPYFAGKNIQYIGYLCISSIMLGATVDYAIILARSYLDHRALKPPREAMRDAISNSAITILTSASILTTCGILIGVISSNGVIAELGTLIGRGAFTAALSTFLFLPALFIGGDKLIQRTSLGLHFHTPGEDDDKPSADKPADDKPVDDQPEYELPKTLEES